MGSDGDGQVSYTEAQAALPGLTQAVFDTVDSDGDGQINRAEAGRTRAVVRAAADARAALLCQNPPRIIGLCDAKRPHSARKVEKTLQSKDA